MMAAVQYDLSDLYRTALQSYFGQENTIEGEFNLFIRQHSSFYFLRESYKWSAQKKNTFLRKFLEKIFLIYLLERPLIANVTYSFIELK